MAAAAHIATPSAVMVRTNPEQQVYNVKHFLLYVPVDKVFQLKFIIKC